MATFQYTARRTDGQQVTGEMTAETEQEVLHGLDDRQLLPIRVTEQRAARAFRIGGGKVGAAAMANLYRQLSDLLRAGVPVLRALEVLERQSSNARLQVILHAIGSDVADGSTLADALRRHPDVFGELETSMVHAGERGGFLEDVLQRIATFRDRQQQIKGQVVGAMIYPVVLMVIGLSLVTGLMIFLVPKFKPLLMRRVADLPGPTTVLFGLSDFLREHGAWLGGGLVIALLLAWPALRSQRGQYLLDSLKLRLPMFGNIVRSLAICRFCRILGTLLKNGVPILASLRIAKDSAGNQLLAEAIDRAADNVQAGDRLAEPLAACGHFPADLIEMIAIGEESNNLENVLVNIAETQETQTMRKVDLMVRMLEPLMLVALAGMVLFIVIALLLPIFKMSSQI